MTTAEILEELKTLGSESNKKVLMRHGAPEPFYGVKIEDLKKIQKRVKKNHALALELYASGVSDAMYLAGLIAEPMKMTRDELDAWARRATWSMLSEYTVAWTAAESRFGPELALRWIDAPEESIASSGWSTWGSLVAIRPDDQLDLDQLVVLLDRVEREIHGAANRVKYTMNGFVGATGAYVAALTERAKQTARAVGVVTVDVGKTACKVPSALDVIKKVETRGTLGKKRKQAAC